MNSEAKWNGVLDLWKQDGTTIFVFWFDESLREAEAVLSERVTGNINFTTAREVGHRPAENNPIVFAEHYPLKKKEEELFENLHLKQVTVLSALDEPLFKKFGSDKIIQIMKQMGMDEKQSIEHNMITKAIHNAQEKMERRITLEQTARSQSDWLEKNLPV